MLKLKLTMQENYNGWSAYVDTGDDNETERELCEKLQDTLPEITVECYDEDGDCVGDPSDYEGEVYAKVAELVGDRQYEVSIDYDVWSS